MVAWAKSLQELLMIMESKGYRRNEYAVVKVPSDELLVTIAGFDRRRDEDGITNII